MILPSINVLDIQTGEKIKSKIHDGFLGLVLILCTSALTMVTGLAGACGAIMLKRGPLLLVSS